MTKAKSEQKAKPPKTSEPAGIVADLLATDPVMSAIPPAPPSTAAELPQWFNDASNYLGKLPQPEYLREFVPGYESLNQFRDCLDRYFPLHVRNELTKTFPPEWHARIAGLRQAIQICREWWEATATHKTETIPALDNQMESILHLLADRNPLLLIQEQLAGPLKLTRETVSKAIQKLSTAGLCHQPLGERKGWTLTEKGLSLAKALATPRR